MKRYRLQPKYTMGNMQSGGNKQPKILDDDWGKIVLQNGNTKVTFRDAVILPTIAHQWNWAWDMNDIMHHDPGVRQKDIDTLILKYGIPDAVILSRGRGYGGQKINSGPGILQVSDVLKNYLKSKGVKHVYILKTNHAIDKYNELTMKNLTVAALIHTTC